MNELIKYLRLSQTPSAPIIKEAADLIEQQAGEIELHKEENKQLREQLHWLLAAKPNVAMVAENQSLRSVAAEMADALEHFGGDPIADEPLGKWKELSK